MCMYVCVCAQLPQLANLHSTRELLSARAHIHQAVKRRTSPCVSLPSSDSRLHRRALALSPAASGARSVHEQEAPARLVCYRRCLVSLALASHQTRRSPSVGGSPDLFAAALSQRLALGSRGGVTENRVWRVGSERGPRGKKRWSWL